MNWTLSYKLNVVSDFDLETAKDHITTTLKNREYEDIKVFYNLISFSNVYYFRRTLHAKAVKVPEGKFHIAAENDLVKVKFIYHVAILDLIGGITAMSLLGGFIDHKFYLLLIFVIIGWVSNYVLIRLEAAELVAACKVKFKAW